MTLAAEMLHLNRPGASTAAWGRRHEQALYVARDEVPSRLSKENLAGGRTHDLPPDYDSRAVAVALSL